MYDYPLQAIALHIDLGQLAALADDLMERIDIRPAVSYGGDFRMLVLMCL